MRLRLVHTLSLWLLATVGASVLAMGAVTAWNLRQGFGAYLQAQDVERLERFVLVAATQISKAGGVQALREHSLTMPMLLSEFARQDGDTRVQVQSQPPGGPAPDLPGGGRRGRPDLGPNAGLNSGANSGPTSGPTSEPDARPNFAPDAGPDFRPPPGRLAGGAGGPPLRSPALPGDFGAQRPPPPGGPPEAFGSRLALYQLDGRPLSGRPLGNDPRALVERPVIVGGQTVALARLRPIERMDDGDERRFLRSQYLGIGAVASVLLLLAVAAAWWLARQWSRPLNAIQDATARIARGELGMRLPVTRADEIGDVVRNVNAMAESLQRIEGSRRRWLADISHELRTPLAGLRGEVEALVDGVRPLTPAAVLSLRDDVLRLGSLVDDLHLLAMADLQSLPIQPQACDAVALVHDTLRRFEARARAGGLTLSLVQAPDRLPVHWDPRRFDQLLGNLLANSLRYTDAPGQVQLRLLQQDDQVRLRVDDSAPGVSAADRARLFEPLFRAGTARNRHGQDGGGSGLGLAICQAIVHSHGGRIDASASVLGGLQVEVWMPVVAEAGP